MDDADDSDEDSQTADVMAHPDADTTIIFITGEGQKPSFTEVMCVKDHRVTSESLTERPSLLECISRSLRDCS